MRAQRGRTKKLIVAFQFQFANQAAWKCDECRKRGLEKQRRCGWLPDVPDEPAHLVWARGGARAHRCPKSLITAESEEWLERWYAGRTFGFGDVLALPARAMDAFCVLESQAAMERNQRNRNEDE